MTGDLQGLKREDPELHPGTAAILAQWRARTPDRELPQKESACVVEAVLAQLRGAVGDHLEQAGRRWGSSNRSVSEILERLSCLRGVLAETFELQSPDMHRAIDRIAATAGEESMRRLELASRTDALTRVGNRRAFDDSIGASLSAAARQGHEVTIAAIDLDGLKQINDTEGHAAGDAALVALVEAFSKELRDEDSVFRIGGDEFVVVLPFTSVGTTDALMQRVASGDAPAFTWGAAGYPDDASTAKELLRAADLDLYRRRNNRRAVAQATPTAAAKPKGARSFPKPRPSVLAAAAAFVAIAFAVSLALADAHIGGGPLRRIGAGAANPALGTAQRPGGSSNHAPAAPSTGASHPTSGTQAVGDLGEGSLDSAFGARSSQPVHGSSPVGDEAALVGETGAVQTPSTGAEGSAGPGSPPGPGSPRAPSPSAGGQGTGGVLGGVGDLVAPVPLVGGGGGVYSSVEQLITGQAPVPTPEAATGAAAAPGARSLSGLLNALGGL